MVQASRGLLDYETTLSSEARERIREIGAADIVIGYALRLAENIGLAKDFGPNVAAYWQRLQARDGYKRAVAAETLAGEQQKVARRS